RAPVLGTAGRRERGGRTRTASGAVTVAIVTDSAAALPAELVTRHRITVVPMWLTIGGESVREGERPLSELLADERVSTAGAERGASLDEVEAEAKDVVERVQLVAAVPNLDHLVRSGRVLGIAGWAGRRLRINPLFEFRGGRVHRLRPALSGDAATDRMVGRLLRSREPNTRLHVAALHALAPEAAEALLERVEAEVTPATKFVGEFGSVMVVHTRSEEH